MDTNQAAEQAHKTETIDHKRFFSEEEIAAMEKEHTNKCVKIDTIEEKIALVKAENAPVLKQLKTDTKSCRKNLKRGFTYEEHECFLVPNFETGMMEFVDQQTGEILQERKLFPDEKQLRLIPIKREGTND